MTKRRGRKGLAPAVLVALAVGAGTAGISTVLGAPGPAQAPPDALSLSAVDRQITLPDPAEAGGELTGPEGAAGPGASAPPVPSTTSAAPTAPNTTTPTSTTTAAPTTTTTTKTTAKPAPKPTTAPPPVDSSAAAQVLAITNEERATAGCAPLAADSRLTKAAQAHSADMAAQRYFSHVSLDGRSFVDRAKAAGYPNPGAENIAQGQRTPKQVMDAWMNSSGHRANILNCGLKTMGLGLDTNGYYWTQVFGR